MKKIYIKAKLSLNLLQVYIVDDFYRAFFSEDARQDFVFSQATNQLLRG
jgi:hypothetical protein